MSKVMVTFRLNAKLRHRMQSYLKRREESALNVPWTVTDFISLAIAEKLDHIERSKKPRKVKKAELHVEDARVAEVPGFNL